MQAGLIGAWERLRYRLVASPTASGVYNLSATLTSRHARSLSDFAEIARLEIAVSRNEQGQASTLFAARWLGNTYTYTDDSARGGSLRIEWVSPRWYLRAVGAAVEWYLTWQAVEVYRDEALVATWPGGGYSVSLFGYRYKAPAAAPLLLVQMAASAVADYIPPPNDDAYSDSSNARIHATGGWAVRVDNQWQAFPVRLQVASPLSPPCDLTLDKSPLMSASDTDSASLTARASASYSQSAWSTAVCDQCPNGPALIPFIYRWRDVITESEHESASVWLIPDLPYELVRLIEPTASLIYRAKLPHCQTLRRTIGSHTRMECNNDIACWDIRSDAQTVYPFTDELLGVLRDGTHALESPLAIATYAPYTWHYVWSRAHTRPGQEIQPGSCPTDQPSDAIMSDAGTVICACDTPVRFQYDTKVIDASVSFPGVATNQCLPYYDHVHEIARYYNTWVNRLWSYLLWFADWPLGVPLMPVSRTDYWLPLQQQWLYHPSLPPSDATRQRNLCCLEPLTVSPHRDWVETELLGVPTLWPGACRFDVLHTPAVTQQQLTSASQPRWSATGATLAFGTNILATPTQATSTLEFELADWAVEPYLYPALCSAVRVQVTGIYNRVRVYLVNFEGDAHELQPDPNDTTLYRYTPAADSVYAGDWAQSYAADLAGYSEVGVDLKPEGRSSSVMADPARRTLWALLHSQTPAKLRIVVEQTAPTPYTLAYPTFYREFSESQAYPLTAHTQAVVDHDSLWRYGGLRFLLTAPVPQLRPVHESPTVYDALCLRNLLYRGQPYQHQMTPDANAIYDSVEWTGAYADLRMDTRSLILPLRARSHPPVWLLINAYREVPPLACLPRRKRDGNLAETGDWGQWQYLISPLRRYYVALDNPVHLHRVEYNASGAETARQVVTMYLEAFGRAHVTYHELALANNEVITRWDGQPLNSPRYLVHSKGDDWARVTPFHGYSAVIWVLSPTLPDYLPIEVDGRRRWLIWGAGDTLYAAHIAQFAPWLTAPHSVDAWRWIAWDSRHGAYLLTAQVGNNWRVYLTRDGGETIQEVLSMQAETLLCESYSAAGLWVALYKTAAGVWVRYSSDAGQSWSSPQAVLLDGVAMTQTPTGLAYDERGGLLLMTYQADNQRHVAVSYDIGATWATVL